MCDVATASLAFSVISGVAGFVGQQQQAGAQANALRYQADMDKNNQIIQGQMAADAIERGKEEERLHRIKIGQLKGTQVNAFAKNGVEVDSGSPLDILGDTAMIGELESLKIRNNAEREAWGYQVNAQNYAASAANNQTAAKNTLSAGKTAGATSLLSTAGTVSSKWYDYKKDGAISWL